MLEQEVLADISPLKITKDRSKSNLSRFNSTASNTSASSSFSSSQASTSCSSSSSSRSLHDVLTPLPSSSSSNASLSRPRPRPAPLVQAVRNHRDRHQSWQIACRLAERAEEMFEESLWIGGNNVEEAMIRARIAREEEGSSRCKVDDAAMRILQLKRSRKGKESIESIPESVSSVDSCASISTEATSSEMDLTEEEEEEAGASIQMAQRVTVVTPVPSPRPDDSPVIHDCGCVGTCFCSAVWSLMA